MTQHFGDAIVTVECSECGARTKRTVANLRTDARVRCSYCCSTITVDGEQLKDAVARFAIAYHHAWTNRSTPSVHRWNHSVHADALVCDSQGEGRVIDSTLKDVKRHYVRSGRRCNRASQGMRLSRQNGRGRSCWGTRGVRDAADEL
jgi:hypothetical protein